MRAFLSLPRKYRDLNLTGPLGQAREYELCMVPKIMVLPGLKYDAFYEAHQPMHAALAKGNHLP